MLFGEGIIDVNESGVDEIMINIGEIAHRPISRGENP